MMIIRDTTMNIPRNLESLKDIKDFVCENFVGAGRERSDILIFGIDLVRGTINIRYKENTSTFSDGDEFVFYAWLYPRKSTGGRKTPLVEPIHAENWFLERCSTWGIGIDEKVHLTSTMPFCGHKDTPYLPSTEFMGKLRVTDHEKFEYHYKHGFGSCSFGTGFMSIITKKET